MLAITRRVSPPAVVGDDKKQVGTFLAETADIFPKSGLIANGCSNLVTVKSHHFGFRVALQGASGNAHGDAVVPQKAHPFGNGLHGRREL